MIERLMSPTGRKWLYGIAIAAIGLLTAYDLVSPDKAPLWIALIVALLGVAAPSVAIKHVPSAFDEDAPIEGEGTGEFIDEPEAG